MDQLLGSTPPGTGNAIEIDRHPLDRLQPIPMRTHGEIEATISEGVSRFEKDHMGRAPKDIYHHLFGELMQGQNS